MHVIIPRPTPELQRVQDGYLRDLALFNVAIDSKLRGCDLVKLAVTDLVKDDRVRERVSVIQSKTKKPVQFELTENTRESVIAWARSPEMIGCRFMFPSRFHGHHSKTTQLPASMQNSPNIENLNQR